MEGFTVHIDYQSERLRYCEGDRWVEMDCTWLGQYRVYPSSMSSQWQGRAGGMDLTQEERSLVLSRVLLHSRARRGMKMHVGC